MPLSKLNMKTSKRKWRMNTKKVESCGLSKEESTTEEKVRIVYELQNKYPLRNLLELSGVKRSTYYYTVLKIDKDMKNDEIMNILIEIDNTHNERIS